MIEKTTKKCIQLPNNVIEKIEAYQEKNNYLTFSEATRQLIFDALKK